MPETWKLKPTFSGETPFHMVKFLIDHAEREGEPIFRLIYEHAGCPPPVERLWVSSLTDDALGPSRDFDALAQAARVRSQAGWMIGMVRTEVA